MRSFRSLLLLPLSLAALISLAASCSSDTPSSPTTQGSTKSALGEWGGDHIRLTVGESASHVELDCAHGDITGAIPIDSSGGFSVSGKFVQEHGGPIQSGEAENSRPARYSGSIHGNSMALTITLTDDNAIIGTYTLQFGQPGRVVKCL